MTTGAQLPKRVRKAFLDPGPNPPQTADAAGGSCPEPGEIWRLVRGELAPREVGAVADHAAACAACFHEVVAARAMAMELGEALEPIPDPKPPVGAAVLAWLRPRWIWLASPALAAAAAAVLFLVAGHPPTGGPEAGRMGVTTPISRTVAEPPALRVPEIVEVSAGALPRERFVLRWHGPEGAFYDVLVEGDDLEPIYQVRDLKTTELWVPKESLRGVQSGKPFIWHVKAYGPDGRPETSATFWVEIR